MLEFCLSLRYLNTRVASLTPSCCGHLSLSTAATMPIVQLVIKQTWVLSSSDYSCLVNIISWCFNFFPVFLFDARGAGVSAGREMDA